MRRNLSYLALAAVSGLVLVGTPAAAPPPKADITAVLAGSGIKVASTPLPAGSEGDVTVSLADCASGQVLKSSGPGNWSCQADATSTGGAAVEHFTNTSSISVPCSFVVYSNANAVRCESTTPSVIATWQQPAGRAATGVFTYIASPNSLTPAGLTCNDPVFGNFAGASLTPDGGSTAGDFVSSLAPPQNNNLGFAIRYSSVPTGRALAVTWYAGFYNCTGGDPSAVTSITVPASAVDVTLTSG